EAAELARVVADPQEGAEAVADAEAAANAAVKHAVDAAAIAAGTGEEAAAACRQDYETPLSLRIGTYPELGQPIDATEAGPLGRLWPHTTPEWYTAGYERMEAALASDESSHLVVTEHGMVADHVRVEIAEEVSA